MVYREEVEFFSYGVKQGQGAVDQNMELILHRFGSKVVEAVDAHPLSLGTIEVSYLPRSMYRLWKLILHFVRLLRVSASFTEER